MAPMRGCTAELQGSYFAEEQDQKVGGRGQSCKYQTSHLERLSKIEGARQDRQKEQRQGAESALEANICVEKEIGGI